MKVYEGIWIYLKVFLFFVNKVINCHFFTRNTQFVAPPRKRMKIGRPKNVATPTNE